MEYQPSHYGLYFNQAQAAAVRANPMSEPYQAAWEKLRGELPEQPFAALYFRAYRYRFLDDLAAGEQALTQLHVLQPIDNTRLARFRQMTAHLHVWEMLRDHPANRATLPPFIAQIDATLADTDALTPLERTWLSTLQIAAGVSLENAPLFEAGAAGFRRVIDEDIDVEGFIKSAVEGKNERTFVRQMQMVCALTLAAEAATHANVNLWQYKNRGVGIATAAAYLVYYYFYPEKWRWSDPDTLTLEMTRQYFREQGAFMEIVTHRAAPRSIELLLDEQRPMFDPLGGGMTTLSHGKAFARKRRRLFGR